MVSPSDSIEVFAAPGKTVGTLRLGAFTAPCSLGRSGILSPKVEGDGGTPGGTFPLRDAWYRADRIRRPDTRLPLHATNPTDGWCDEPSDRSYNRAVRLPYPADAEQMWRDDHLYDLLAVVGYNDQPVVPGAGSAIFLHVVHEQNGAFLPTSGCISMRIEHLTYLLRRCRPSTRITIRIE